MLSVDTKRVAFFLSLEGSGLVVVLSGDDNPLQTCGLRVKI